VHLVSGRPKDHVSLAPVQVCRGRAEVPWLQQKLQPECSHARRARCCHSSSTVHCCTGVVCVAVSGQSGKAGTAPCAYPIPCSCLLWSLSAAGSAHVWLPCAACAVCAGRLFKGPLGLAC
jgi:hypothetical protein